MIIGITKLLQDLSALGYEAVHHQKDTNGLDYAIINGFEIPVGSFAGRKIDLAIPAPTDYPRSVGASMHIKADPELAPMGNIPNVRNVIQSQLGSTWQYWSFAFKARSLNPTTELISQINEIFRKN